MEWDAVITAVAVVVATLLVGWICHKVGRWILHAAKQSFAVVVVDAMAPEMAHNSKQVSSSLAEMTAANTKEHEVTAGRLTAVESRLANVEAAIARPATARTRHTDRDRGHP